MTKTGLRIKLVVENNFAVCCILCGVSTVNISKQNAVAATKLLRLNVE
jgi:hypothetical protein